ncbi:MAG: hypothetical protein H0W88_04285 [Parachlamydiaceae bacterium]|nr:hypothetical protein [Parachlamydiaceae bacterium]
MSNLKSSIVLEEIDEYTCEVIDINLLSRELNNSNTTQKTQSACQIVKISGSITISF